MKIDRANDRLYIQAGYGYLIGYTLSTFASRMGSPLATGAHGEQFLYWTMKVNAETDSWSIIMADGAIRLTDFDFDQRGFIYLAYTLFGWGIVDRTGHLVHQFTNQTGWPTPSVILTFASSGHQYALVSNGSSSLLWDVTDTHSAVNKGSVGFGVLKYAKNDSGDAIAIVTGTQALQIFTPDQIVNGGTPITIAPSTAFSSAGFTDVTTDGVNFYASQDGSISGLQGVVVSTVSPGGGTYTRVDQAPLFNAFTRSLTYGSGYLAWIGLNPSTPASLGELYAFDGTHFTPTDISSYLQTNYGTSFEQPRQVLVYCASTTAYALLGAHGLGDLFTITPAVSPCMPGPPTGVTATAGNASASVSFASPASDGGSPVTSYVVVSNPGQIRATGTSSPIEIDGLVNGQAYTFTVAAQNSVGLSAPSDPSNSVTPSGPMPAPAQLVATASSTTSVALQWMATPGAAQYEVMRSSMGSAFSPLAPAFGMYYLDSSLSPNTTYVYRVHAVDAANNTSPDSAPDAATTVLFTDDPLTAGKLTLMTYMNELRTAATAMSAAANVTGLTFTDPTLDSDTQVKAIHIVELRAIIDGARAAIGLPALPYTDPTITSGETVLKAVHLQELRDAVK